MRTRPMISLTAATGLIDAIAAGGGDPDAVLSSVGLTRRAVSSPGGAKHTLTEIAYLLGYSDVSAFNRAFRRWTGSTPSDHRKKSSQ